MQTSFTKAYGGGVPRGGMRGVEPGRGLRRMQSERAEGAMSVGVERRAKGLGWFSIGLGLAALFSPRATARFSGVPDDVGSCTVLRAIGAREVLCGIGILARPQRSGFVWARVVSDLMDLALLGNALGLRKANRPKVLRSMASVAGVLVLDALTATQLRRAGRGASESRAPKVSRGSIRVTKSITVNRPPADVYAFWRDLQNLPVFMVHLESIDVNDGQSHWRAKGPAGAIVEWDATVIEDRPNELLAWKSLQGGDVDNAGIVEFIAAPGGRGTIIRVDLRYDPPGRRAAALVAKLFRADPAHEIESDLRRFKQVIETGEVVHSDASIHPGPHAARPPTEKELS
jgi:uncharacterized membrane protein